MVKMRAVHVTDSASKAQTASVGGHYAAVSWPSARRACAHALVSPRVFSGVKSRKILARFPLNRDRPE